MKWWDILSRTVASEFSDIPDFEHAIRVTVRLVLAAFLGGVLGYHDEILLSRRNFARAGRGFEYS